MTRRVVLGPDSPSMRLCAQLAREAGAEVVEARAQSLDQDGDETWERVTAANAYRADWPEPHDGDVWVLAAPAVPKGTFAATHHEHGGTTEIAYKQSFTIIGPVLDASPAEFLPASTVGRLLLLIGAPSTMFDLGQTTDPEGWYGETPRMWRHWRLSHGGRQYRFDEDRTILHTAAAEHWREAAMRGECPGVDAREFKRWCA